SGPPWTGAKCASGGSMWASWGSSSSAPLRRSPLSSPTAPPPTEGPRMTAYLKIDHLDKSFARGSQTTEVLRDVTLTIDKGEFVSIIGHSGCGKSTLLNVVAGLIPASRGGVLLENREVDEPGPDRAVVFQNHSLLPWLTVYDNVRLAVDKVFGGTKSRAERDAWTLHNLDLVQMTHAKDKRPAE